MKWVKRGVIFAPGQESGWIRSHAQIPLGDHVNEEVLRIYFSTRDSEGRSLPTYIEVEADNPQNVLYVHPEPIIALGRLGTFDDSGIMPFCIVNRENEKRLYYVGWNRRATVPYHQAIGLAVSTDSGRSFTRYSEGPICERSVNEPFFCTAPWVMVQNNRWKMWYVSCTRWEIIEGQAEPLYLVKYAESSDGIDWEITGTVCIGYDESTEAIARPFVFVEGGLYKMYFSFRSASGYRTDPERSYKLGYAESEDGISWVRKDDEARISRSESGWDSEMIAYCQGYMHQGRRYMLYNGNGFGRSGIGYAVFE
jgi:hypothetical protein